MRLEQTVYYSKDESYKFPLTATFVNPYVRCADTYKPPLFEKDGCRLYMNENLFGPSPKCLEAVHNASEEQLFLYPYGGDLMIRQAVAERTGVEAEQVMVNQGAASVIQHIFQTVFCRDDAVLVPFPGWDYYRSVAETLGVRVHYYNISESCGRYVFDVDEMIKAIREVHPKIIVVTSPNMPTGNMISIPDLTRLALCEPDSLILLDEAYYGFTLKPPFSESKILLQYPNIMIMRTFSKLYGLAALRMGYVLCCRSLCRMLSKTAPLFGVSLLSQLVAKAALEDVEYYEKLKMNIIRIRENFCRQVNEIAGMRAYPSEANFILINASHWPSDAIVRHCRDNNYLIRDCKGYKLKNHLRVSIGTEKNMNDILYLLRSFAGT